MIDDTLSPPIPTTGGVGKNGRGVGGVGVRKISQPNQLATMPMKRCDECGNLPKSTRHWLKDGKCKMTHRKKQNARARAIDDAPFALRPPTPSNADDEDQVKKRLDRYYTMSDDLRKLGLDDWRVINQVVEYLFSNHRTGALLPVKRRLAILDELDKFPELAVAKACISFHDAGCIRDGKPFRYFLGICRGSASTFYTEVRAERERMGKFKLE